MEQVVADVAQNGVIRGTKEYNKDEFVSGAKAASSSSRFSAMEGGRQGLLQSSRAGARPPQLQGQQRLRNPGCALCGQAQGEKNTILRIDALFKEDFRQIVHQSDGSVENAEYQDIREHIEPSS